MPIETEMAGQMGPPGGTGAARVVQTAMLRGARGRCPACGEGALTHAYLKVVDHCGSCGEALHHQRADDAPAYFTMLVVGHVIVGGVLALEQALAPPTWVQLAIWLPLTLVMSLLLLPAVKGALVGLQWALRMHGFGAAPDPDAPPPDPALATAEDRRGHRA